MSAKISDAQVEQAFKTFMEGHPDRWSPEDLKEMFDAEREAEEQQMSPRDMLRYLLARGKIEV